MKKPQPEYFTTNQGRDLVRLPVTGSPAPAITEAALWDNAKQRHSLSGGLYATDDGSGKRRYVLAGIERGTTHSPLARLLLDCPKGYQVRYNDRNSLNLLPENFRLVSTWAPQDVRGEMLRLLVEAARRPLVADDAQA